MCEEIKKEQVQELMDFLMGKKIPEGWEMSHPPKLSHNKAFRVIYFLQEHLGIIPDTFEKCDVCHKIYDTWSEGYVLGEDHTLKERQLPKKYWGFYCNQCVPDIDFKIG